MDSEITKIIIEKLPKTAWYKEWIPIFIALIALVTSLISLHWTRQGITKSNRPFVWASSSVVIDSEQKTFIPIPSQIGFRVKNNPARIIRIDIAIKYNSETIFNYVIQNIFKFPDETSNWYFSIGQNEFEEIINRPITNKKKLTREIKIKYSALNEGKIYSYRLEQYFKPGDNQWIDIYEKAN